MHRIIQRSLPLTATVLGVALAAGCAKKKADATDTTTTDGGTVAGGGAGGGGSATGSNVPQVGAIQLSGLGSSTAALALDDAAPTCKQGDTDGVMGLALAPACSTAPLAAMVIQGHQSLDFDGNGKVDCDDFAAAKTASKDPGLLLNLICQPVALNHNDLVSVAVGTTSASLAISFAPWEGDTNSAVGEWAAGSAASFPADIRIWTGAGLDALKGVAAIALSDINNGEIQLADVGNGKAAGGAIPVKAKFSTKSDTSGCTATAISDTACHWQEIWAYSGEGDSVGTVPNGFHLKVWADKKVDPTVIAVEGKYRYTSGTASHFPTTICNGNLANTREIYFQVVQTGGQDWGTFQFKDESGAEITCPVTFAGQTFDLMSKLSSAAGQCQNVGSKDAVDCTAVDYKNYASLWTGEAGFANVTASPIASTLFTTGAPTAPGVCLAGSGCREFNATDIAQ